VDHPWEWSTHGKELQHISLYVLKLTSLSLVCVCVLCVRVCWRACVHASVRVRERERRERERCLNPRLLGSSWKVLCTMLETTLSKAWVVVSWAKNVHQTNLIEYKLNRYPCPQFCFKFLACHYVYKFFKEHLQPILLSLYLVTSCILGVALHSNNGIFPSHPK